DRTVSTSSSPRSATAYATTDMGPPTSGIPTRRTQSRCSIARREDPLGDQLPAQLDGVGMIDRQHADRDAADRSQADQLRATPAEVLRPPVAPRIVQSDNFTC